MRQIKGVIFDMDGLMFDTERLSMRSWTHVGAKMGYEIDNEMVLRITGMNATGASEIIQNYLGEDFDMDRFRVLSSAYYDRFFEENGVPHKEGLTLLLDYLKDNGYPVIVATSTRRERAEKYMEIAGVTGYFRQIVCGNEVQRSKPDPDIFLEAARRIGLAPEECLVLEDSPNGINAGEAAGCAVIAVPDICELSETVRAKCVAVLPTLADVIAVLKENRR